jgi:hypothetical protein
MTYTDFAEKMLIALYQESESHAGTYVRFKELIHKYGLPSNERWLDRLSDEWGSDGMAEVHAHIGSPLEWGVEISGRGMRAIESRYGGKDGVGAILKPVVQTSTPDDAAVADRDAETSVDSSQWTGLPSSFVLSEEKRARLVACLQSAEADLDKLGAGNHEKAQARAYIVAARALAEAPDPPTELIWQLIQRANSIAGIASLFVSVVALFAS